MTSLAVPNATAAMASAATAASTTAFQSGGATAGSAATAATAGSAASLTQNDFLQLLTAQLKYQTPSSPADPTQLASEFAAISTVDGINQLNTQVGSIETSAAAAQLAQAATLVGKQVAVPGDTLHAGANGAAQGAFNLAGPAQDVQVLILNPNGSTAGKLNLGALAPGQQQFQWSGTAGNSYSYDISATAASGAAVPVTPYSVYSVAGVNVSGTTPTLNVAGSATPLPISSLATILGDPST